METPRNHEEIMDIGTTILGVMGIVPGLLMPVTLVGSILWYKSRKDERLHDTALKLASSGQPIPPELFSDGWGPNTSHVDLVTDTMTPTLMGMAVVLVTLYAVSIGGALRES